MLLILGAKYYIGDKTRDVGSRLRSITLSVFFYISFLTLDVVSHHVPLDMHICILPMFSVSRFIFGQQSPVSTFIKTDCLGLVLANTPCT